MAPCVAFCLNYFLLVLLLLNSIHQTHQDILPGYSLSTDGPNSSWVSPSGEFAFGFYRLEDSGLYLLAIWFNKIVDRTVVWCANGDDPVQRGSKLELKIDKWVVLYDHQGKEKWKSEGAKVGVASAEMRDTGNFVLLGEDSSIIWESFNEPTDTILPTQSLRRSSKLSSYRKKSEFSKGRFRLQFDNAKVELYTVAPPSESAYQEYWSTENAGFASQVVLNASGYFYLEQTDGIIYRFTQSEKIVSTKDFYYRVTLDYDGVLRQSVYPKTSQSGWAELWSVVWYEPKDICKHTDIEIGSVACGFNSYCRLDEEQRPRCTCPPGYSPLDQQNNFGGCKQDFKPQSCESGGESEASKFELREMRNVDWRLNDYEEYSSIDEGQCRLKCLNDCFCAVAVYTEQGSCWKKKMPLSNGKMDTDVSRKTFIKVRKGNLTSQSPANSCKEKDRVILILVGSVLFGSSGVLNLLLLLAISLVLLYSYHQKPKNLYHNTSMLGVTMHTFTFKELEQATDGFKEELGRGAFGIIYKGALTLDSRHLLVAVKKLDNAAYRVDREFETEMTTIGQTHHNNLTRLLGFCSEGPNRLLVYEFMSNGSLASFLFGSMRPNWNQRVQIALGIARGLMYLHEECSTQIIHCDINPQSILLDEFFMARISDFGLAKLMMADQTRSITTIRGTKGYVAPEWFKNTPITAKVDVYSFGVLLLEIICCRPNVILGLENEERVILTDWAHDCYIDRKMNLLVENDEEVMNDVKGLEKFVMVAIWCIQENPTMRPSMEKVTEMLEGVTKVSTPPYPYSFSSVGWKST